LIPLLSMEWEWGARREGLRGRNGQRDECYAQEQDSDADCYLTIRHHCPCAFVRNDWENYYDSGGAHSFGHRSWPRAARGGEHPRNVGCRGDRSLESEPGRPCAPVWMGCGWRVNSSHFFQLPIFQGQQEANRAAANCSRWPRKQRLAAAAPKSRGYPSTIGCVRPKPSCFWIPQAPLQRKTPNSRVFRNFHAPFFARRI
jgi:hypothetical protein